MSSLFSDPLLKSLVEIGAFYSGHFKLRNGKHSAIYFDKHRLFTNTPLLRTFIDRLLVVLPDLKPISVVVAPAYGAIPPATLIASQTHKNLLILERSGQTFKSRSPHLWTDARALLLDDVYNTGGTLHIAAQHCNYHHVSPMLQACVINKNTDHSNRVYCALRIPLYEFFHDNLPNFLHDIAPCDTNLQNLHSCELVKSVTDLARIIDLSRSFSEMNTEMCSHQIAV